MRLRYRLGYLSMTLPESQWRQLQASFLTLKWAQNAHRSLPWIARNKEGLLDDKQCSSWHVHSVTDKVIDRQLYIRPSRFIYILADHNSCPRLPSSMPHLFNPIPQIPEARGLSGPKGCNIKKWSLALPTWTFVVWRPLSSWRPVFIYKLWPVK